MREQLLLLADDSNGQTLADIGRHWRSRQKREITDITDITDIADH